MNLDLSAEQRTQLELISMHAGKPPAEVLIEAALFLLGFDDEYWGSQARQEIIPSCQTFLPGDELEARFCNLLRRSGMTQRH